MSLVRIGLSCDPNGAEKSGQGQSPSPYIFLVSLPSCNVRTWFFFLTKGEQILPTAIN